MSEPNPSVPITPKLISRLGAGFVQENITNTPNQGETKREGSLAQTLKPVGKSQQLDVVRDFRWTMSSLPKEDIDEVPYIRLQEFKCVDSSIKKQIQFYANVIPQVLKDNLGNLIQADSKGILDPYKDIWPHDNPTGFTYIFPYFNKTGFELASEPWASLDPIGESVKNIAGGVGNLFGENTNNLVSKALKFAQAASNTALNAQYPSVGITDRPKIFMAHTDRTINISFTLYNTFMEEEWRDNRDLLYILMSQNLFNKRDHMTGIPPVFYSVYIPGQYFCYAANISNFKVEHLGNQRLLYGEHIIPDAYQVEISLTELVKPSKNQFEAIVTNEALNKVSVQT